MLTNSEIASIEKKVDAAKSLLDDICHIADGKDGNVVFLSNYRSKELDTIIKCAKLNGRISLPEPPRISITLS